MFLFNIFLTISTNKNFALKIENVRVVENIFPEKVSHDFWKLNDFSKIIKKR